MNHIHCNLLSKQSFKAAGALIRHFVYVDEDKVHFEVGRNSVNN